MMNSRNILNPGRNIGIIILSLLFCGLVSVQSRSQESHTEILWDTYGVPHIFAGSAEEMYYAFGWAQMQNHADLILKLYGQARGRASEYWGEEYLETDKQVALFEIPDHAERNCRKQKEPYRSWLDAFVRGVNDFARRYPDQITEKYKRVLPIGGQDVMAHVLRVLCLEFIAYDDLNAVKQSFTKGSNAIAISPSRSASGNAMLVTNPHLPWHDFYIWFEAHLSSPGFTAYGITLVGAPTLSMAFNDNLGWAFTVNTLDGADRYSLTLRNSGYLLDGREKSFTIKNKVIKVLQREGGLIEKPFGFKYSVHGPVVLEGKDGATSLRIVGLDNFGVFEQYHKMAAASDLSEFESALRMLQNPMFNIIYADKAGNILYLFNGNVPRRPVGDFAFWKGSVDGTKSSYIWKSTHGYDDLPRVLNPTGGFIQNCNDAPWVCTWPPVLDPSEYPEYMAPKTMLLRPQRAVNMIKDNPSVTFSQLIDCKLNTGVEAAERFLDDLFIAVEQYPDSIALLAVQVLKNWDRKTDSESRGAILFMKWMDKLRGSDFAIPWSFENPVTTPDGLKDYRKATEYLKLAAAETLKTYGALDINWGSVYRFRMNNLDFPANGGPAQYGIFRTIDFMEDVDSKKRAVFGDTYVAVTEFSTPVKAMVLLSYGNATQPGNRHIGDQLELLSGKQLRPALLNRQSILENLEKRESVSLNQYK